MTELARLTAALHTRDTFLATVSTKLSALVREIEMADYDADGRARLSAFVRELALIARPDEPIVPETRAADLVAIVATFFAPERLAEVGARATLEETGRISGTWDTELLGTLLGELASNAMKYRGDGPVSITVTARRGRARIVLTNDGVLPSPALRPERFVRAETRAEVRGYGVGRWLVARIAEAHGGRASLTSSRGKTRAIVNLPCTSATADARLEVTVHGPNEAPPRAAPAPREAYRSETRRASGSGA